MMFFFMVSMSGDEDRPIFDKLIIGGRVIKLLGGLFYGYSY